MNEIQASVLRIKLRSLDDRNAARRRVAERYHRDLMEVAIEHPDLPSQPTAHVWHIYAVRVRSRDAFAEHLRLNGVQTLIHYPKTIPRQPAYSSREFGAFPTADDLESRILSLPISPALSEADLEHVISAAAAWSSSPRAT
jgi:dTDP-4-amino-4,6-dideoxygalactose transaminase